MSSSESSLDEDEYNSDPKKPCQYGNKCYRKNPQHLKEFKHPTRSKKLSESPTRDDKKRKNREGSSESDSLPDVKVRKENSDSESAGSDDDELNNQLVTMLDKFEAEGTTADGSNVNGENSKGEADSDIDEFPFEVQKKIEELFSVKMPKDFYKFYKFCESLSAKDPSKACKLVGLELVGAFDVLSGKIKDDAVQDEKYLRHWRYFYDVPEFQTVLKADDKEGLHFGYWRDNPKSLPVFVGKNSASKDCKITPEAPNIFAAVNTHMENKLKTAGPFNKMPITRLQKQLKTFAKEHGISLDNQSTSTMRDREKEVVAKTFHSAGIVVPYEKKTQLGYRDLAVTDSQLKKILKRIDEAEDSDVRNKPLSELLEVVRLATIAADECDFGTCLELAHDLFSSGSPHAHNVLLNMFSMAYSLLDRPEFLSIVKSHLKDRKQGNNLSVI